MNTHRFVNNFAPRNFMESRDQYMIRCLQDGLTPDPFYSGKSAEQHAQWVEARNNPVRTEPIGYDNGSKRFKYADSKYSPWESFNCFARVAIKTSNGPPPRSGDSLHNTEAYSVNKTPCDPSSYRMSLSIMRRTDDGASAKIIDIKAPIEKSECYRILKETFKVCKRHDNFENKTLFAGRYNYESEDLLSDESDLES